ncbi:uncharacterized protein PAC_14575 [Phialocephala subalpina]|uniref:Uncharacterized protein n=1 Tax=Phialocephala subalpina TaxID=576137 RepID=A0A1L7XI94_9HELO|nr:uncharacterized protein PAC_14575 [Phialocephala subalpina]
MKSALLLLPALAATCFGAAVPVPERDALLARDDQIVTVIVTITSTTTKATSTTKKTITSKPNSTVVVVTVTSTVTQASTTAAPATTAWEPPHWGPWTSGFRPPWWSSWLTQATQASPVTITASEGPVTVYLPTYITVTATETDSDDGYAATVTLPALTLGGKRDMDEEPRHSGPDHWHHTIWNTHTSVYYPPQQTVSTVYAYPHSTISTVYVYPPQPSTTTVTDYIVVETDTTSETPPRITFYPPRNAAPEPEAKAQIFGLGPASRTVQGAPTPPLPWWNWWATATPSVEIIDRDTNEKREPQTLEFGDSRTVEGAPPSTTLDWTFWDPPHHPGHRVTTTKPYEIDKTTTLSFLTIYKKRDPQSLGFPSRTNEITPTGPSYTHHHHSTDSTSVSTVIVTVTEYPYTATSHPYHHPTTISTIIFSAPPDYPISTIVYSPTTDYYTPSQTGTTIEATLTLPFSTIPVFTGIATPSGLNINGKRSAAPEPNPEPQTYSLGFPTTASYLPTETSRPKENPCQNNVFLPPWWCSSPSLSVTTYTGTVFENTATLPSLTIGTDPAWWGNGRKNKRSRQRVAAAEAQEDWDLEERQQLLGTQTRTFTSTSPAATPSVVQ